MKWWLRAIIFFVFLIPSGYFAWQNCEMKQLGWMADDTVYLASAKSLIAGAGYRMEALPNEPWQTKYPPVLPLLISAALLLFPGGESGSSILWLVAWCGVPLLLAFCWRLFLLWGYSELESLILVAFLATNVYLAFFGSILITEILFTSAVAGGILAYARAESRDSALAWLMCGIVVGICFLLRTMALPLAILLPALGWVRKRSPRVVWFLVGASPFVVGWMLWTATHGAPDRDLVTIYHTDYLGDLLWNANLSNYHLMLWKNFASLFRSLGKLIIPGISDDDILSSFMKQAMGLAGIFGTFRLCREKPQAVPYGVSAGGLALLVVIWCYPPNERMIFPLFPIFLAGFGWELRNLIFMIRQAWRRQTAVAVVFSGILVIGIGLAAVQHVYAWSDTIRHTAEIYRPMSDDNQACFERIRSEIASSERFVTLDESLLWLATGSKAVGMRAPIAWLYEERDDATIELFSTPERFAERYSANYVFLNLRFLGLKRSVAQPVRERLLSNPNLKLVFQCGEARLWRVAR